MKTVFVVLLAVAGVAASGHWLDEHWTSVRARANGDPMRAYALYTSLAGQRLWFLERADVEKRRATAAADALPVAVRDRNFDLAATLGSVVRGAAGTGLDATGARALLRLSEAHLQYIDELIAGGLYEQALAEGARASGAYATEEGIPQRVVALRTQAHLALARKMVGANDLAGAVAILARFEADASTSDQYQAVSLVREAVAQRADWYVTNRDFPGLLRWFRSAHDTLDARANLLREAMLVYGSYAQRVFDLPSSAVADTPDVEEPPIARATGASASGYAILSITNRASQPFTVVLRGPHDYKTTTPVRPGQSVRIAAPPGQYAEAVFSSTWEPLPYLGVIRLVAVEYSQEFTVGEVGGERGRSWAVPPGDDRRREGRPTGPGRRVAAVTVRASANDHP